MTPPTPFRIVGTASLIALSVGLSGCASAEIVPKEVAETRPLETGWLWEGPNGDQDDTTVIMYLDLPKADAEALPAYVPGQLLQGNATVLVTMEADGSSWNCESALMLSSETSGFELHKVSDDEGRLGNVDFVMNRVPVVYENDALYVSLALSEEDGDGSAAEPRKFERASLADFEKNRRQSNENAVSGPEENTSLKCA